MAAAAVALAAQERYRGAGTIEFVVDATTKEFFFLEMNTRIQVEHPVTEMTTGHDLVALQIRLARGDDLSDLTQDGIRQEGHAIECRIYAENPARMFLPSPGPLEVFRLPEPGDWVRIDAGVREGDRITPHYDPLIAKLICRGADRAEAIERAIAGVAREHDRGHPQQSAVPDQDARTSGVPRRRGPHRVRRNAPAGTRGRLNGGRRT